MTRRFLMTTLFAAAWMMAACGGGGGGGQVANQDLPDATPADLQGQDLPGQDLKQPDPGGQDAKDPGQVDPGQLDPGQTDPAQVDPGTTDPGKVDPGQADPGQTDPGQTDPGQIDPGTPDPGQPDIPAGNGTCVDIVGCVNDNACQTQACVQQCMATGSVEAQNQFAALAQCEVQQCGQYGQNQPSQAAYCVYSKCKAQNQPCTKTGNLGCMAMLQCAQGCGNPPDQACVMNCFGQGTYDGQTALFAVAACVEEKCPNADQQCILSNCFQQVMACQSS